MGWKWTSGLAVVGAVLLAGCEFDLDSNPGGTPTPTPSPSPTPSFVVTVDFASVAHGPQTLESLCAALVHAGYSQGTAITLAEPPGLCVVRAFVSGLGSMSRRRRTVRH